VNSLYSGLQAEVDLNTAKVSNVDHPLVETAVPIGAVFTDTVYDDTAIQAEVDANTAKVGVTTEEANPDLISQAEAEAGTATTERTFSALRVAQAIAALGGGGGSPITTVYKTADETKVSDIVLALDTDLQMTLEGNSVYSFETKMLWGAHPDADLVYQFNVPTNTEIYWSYDLDNTVFPAYLAYNSSTVQGNSGKMLGRFYGVLITSASPVGDFGLKWRQGASNANPSIIYKGSLITLTKLN